MRRLTSVMSAFIAVVVVAGLSYWAGTNALVPPELAVESHQQETYQVAEGSVGRVTRVAVSASWKTVQTLLAGADGVVTSVVHQPGSAAAPGDVLLTVDLEPVVVAAGAVPMFRALQEGMTGPDIRQLQELLLTAGFLEGPADGRFGPITAVATKRWQRSIGAEPDGIVDAGALLFVARLPVRLDVTARIGEHISAGAELVRVLGEQPDIIALVSASQRAELESGMSISIDSPTGATWSGRLGSFESLNDGRYAAAITGDPCGEPCDIPVGGETALSGEIELVPETAGPVVPRSALIQQPSGGLAVLLPDGTPRAVDVLAEADGFAVVDGLDVGTVIVLPSPPSP